MGNCVCGHNVYAKAMCRRCYEKQLPRAHIYWKSKRVAQERSYRRKLLLNKLNKRKYAHETHSMHGEDALDALCMAFNLEPLDLARFILDLRDLHRHERIGRRYAERRVFASGAFAPQAAARTGT